MKKIIYFLIVTLVTSMISAFPVFAEETLDERIKVVVDLGIVSGDESNDLMLDKNITRAEMATVVYRLKYGNTEFFATKQVFGDVDFNHWAASYIEALYDGKIISGDENGNFRPKDNVSTAELYKMLLNVAGYGNYLTTIGSYPDNVMKAAFDSGLSLDINFPADKQLTRKEAFIIIYNLLDINVLDPKTYNDFETVYTDGDIFLNHQLKVYTDKGTVMGAENVNSDGSTLSDGLAVIDGIIYENKAGITVDSIGLSGEFYYREEAGELRTLLCFLPGRKNNILEISSADIVEYASNRYTYMVSGKRKTADLNPEKDIYYNDHTVLSEYYTVEVLKFDDEGNPVLDNKTGLQIVDKIEKSYMKPAYGNVKLIDSNGDKEYDTVMVEEYQNMLCSYTSENSEVIYGMMDGKTVAIDLKALEEYKIQDKKGKSVVMRNIKKDTLLSLQYYDENKGLVITVCEDIAEGDITGIQSNDYYETILTVDGKNYNVAPSNANAGEEFKFNLSVVLHIDIYGNVGAVTYTDTKSSWKYGFVLKFVCDTEDESLPAILKLVDTSGTVCDYECSEKLRVDNIKQDRETLKENLIYGTVIRYLQDKQNKVLMIDTPVKLDITERDIKVDENDTLLERVSAKETKYCITGNQSFTSINGAVFYDTDTEFLYVSQLAAGESYKDAIYEKRTASNLSNQTGYKISAYNADPENLTADFIILHVDENKESIGADAMLVESVSKAINKDGDITYQITGLYGGQNVSYNLKNNDMINTGNHTITKGDAIKIRLISNEITHVRLVYSPSEPDAKDSLLKPGTETQQIWVFGSGWSTSNWSSNTHIFEFGWIERVQNPNIVFEREVIGKNPYSFYNAVKYFNIYIYDKSNPNNPITIGTINDIKTREQYPDDYDTVVLGSQGTAGKVLILYRN